MARNRQRAKERQAERRAARQAAGDARQPAADKTGSPEPLDTGSDDPLFPQGPPQRLGQPGYTLDHTSEAEEFIGDLQVGDEPYPAEDLEEDSADAAAAGPRGVRGGRELEEHEHRERGRVLGFLAASWAELQRVQWPDRQTLTSLTGVTLMFVLIVGGYLGLLDAIFSKLVQAIL
jgi:preprotein translocase subunit SecE